MSQDMETISLAILNPVTDFLVLWKELDLFLFLTLIEQKKTTINAAHS